MCKEQIRNRDFGQRLNGRGKDSQNDPMRIPFVLVSGRIRGPQDRKRAQEGGYHIDATAAIDESYRLPDEVCPAQEQEHEAGAQVELRDSEASVVGNVCED